LSLVLVANLAPLICLKELSTFSEMLENVLDSMSWKEKLLKSFQILRMLV